MEVLRLNLLSGPRNVSTALMYSFAQREDTRVVDEPLYGYYLKLSGADHPGREEVLAAMDCEGERVVKEVILGPCDRRVLFIKNMAHHLVGLDPGFLKQTCNVFLVRDPREMLPSLINQIPEPTLQDTGLNRQAELFEQMRRWGQSPIVLEARELLLNPERVLRELCQKVGLAFVPAMLTWVAGPRPEDGVWARHWYHNLHRSTGFQKYKAKTEPFPERLRPLLEECRPYYERLYLHAIKAAGG